LKYFGEFALTNKTLKQRNWNQNKMLQWELDVKAIANVCAAQNPNFNRERWLGYIAGTNGKNGGKL